MIVVVCECGMRHELPDEWAGKTGRCPGCKAVLEVPATGAQAQGGGAPESQTPVAQDTAPASPAPGQSGGEGPMTEKQADPEIAGFTFDYGEDPREQDKRLAAEDEQPPEAGTPQKPEKIRFRCTCGKVLVAPGERAGAKARCPQCKKVVVVPAPEPEEEDDDEGQFADLFGYEDAEKQASLSCDHCGTEMAPGAVLCTYCGINKLTGVQLETATGSVAQIDDEEGGLLGKVAFWKKPKPTTHKTIAEDKDGGDQSAEAGGEEEAPSEKDE